MTFDEQMMLRCLELAAMGMGNVAPNPMVGAVIVHNGKIIGEGYHEKFGGPHAEVNAINAIDNQEILSECTIYVSLEPCSHFGKTPPCADLLVAKKFKRVVVGTIDPHAKVFKKGIQRLEDNGLDVNVGVCEKSCLELNRTFFTFHEKKRPYIILKWAQTKNGLIDNAEGKTGEVSWISSPETQVKVHKWRSEVQSILIGKNTAINDNPTLTVRAVVGKNPTRILLDSHLRVQDDANIFDQQTETIVFNIKEESTENKIRRVKVSNMKPQTILDVLVNDDIQTVMIEGGRSILQAFIDAKLWDEARIIIGATTFESGTKAPEMNGQMIKEELHFGDHITYLRPL